VREATGLRVPSESHIREIESTSRLSFAGGAYTVSTPLVAHRQPSDPHAADGPADPPASTKAPALAGLGLHELVPVGFVLTARALLSVRFAPVLALEAARATADAEAPKTAEDAFLRILELVVDRAADALERASAECDELSRGAFRDGGRSRAPNRLQKALLRVGDVADRISLVRDALLGVGRIAAYVTEGGREGAPPVNATRMRAIRTDVTSLTDYEAHLAGKVQFLLDATLGFINIEQNEIVKTLTIASVVGIPPVLVVGIYGMNFHDMPELGWRYGYPMSLALIVVTAALPLVWFKRRGWL
jgi:magnesium transporter